MMRYDEDFSSGHFLRDIKEISKALYLHNNQPKALNISSDHRSDVADGTGISESDSKFPIQDSPRKDKKPSIWNWKLLKALAHIRNQRFNCCFFLHVHAVEGLPSDFNNLNLCLTWKRKGDLIRTRPATVCAGISEFEETLMHRCTVYASRTGMQSSVKYESKLFLLRISVIEAPELEIGKHWIDLTRLLPLTLKELEREKRSSGRWTTSFKLTGNAKGAMLHVSFGFSILDGNSFEPGYFVKVPDVVRVGGPFKENHLDDLGRISRTGHQYNHDTIPTNLTQQSHHQCQTVDINILDENFAAQEPELAPSITVLSQKLDEEKMRNDIEPDFFHEPLESLRLKFGLSPEYAGECTGRESNDVEFTVVDQGVELSMKDSFRRGEHGSQRFDSSLIETIDVAEIFKEEESAFDEDAESKPELHKSGHDENEIATDSTEFKHDRDSVKEPTFQELDSVSYEVLTSRSAELDSLPDISKYHKQENYTTTKSSFYKSKSIKSFGSEDAAESVENDFLKMLSVEQTPASTISGTESPGGTLLMLFEEDTVAWENHILDTDLKVEQKESLCPSLNGYSRLAHADDSDLSLATQVVEMNHGSLTQLKRNAKMLEDLETQSLMHKWGLDENAFQNSPRDSSGGFGSPVYFPAEEPLKLPCLGEGLGPIIQTKDGGFLRSMNPLLFVKANNGARLIVQVSAPVVIPAAMGLTAMDILQRWADGGVEKMSTQAKELMPLEDITRKKLKQVVSEAESRSKRWTSPHEHKAGFEAFSEKKTADMESEYVSFENLVPTAMTNIEGLLIEGLNVQSGMQYQEAPSHIKLQFSANSASVTKTTKCSGNFSSDRTSGVRDVDELVKYFLSLEEWLRMDSGDSDAKDKIDELSSKVVAPDCAKNILSSSGQLIKEDQMVNLLDRKYSNNFTMALNVQLRDPLRDYEDVGSSMLALIQIERICNEAVDNLEEKVVQKVIGFEQKQSVNGNGFFPQFKILEVHLTGFIGNQQLWGTSRQHQSGVRWLLSSGMAKTKKHYISNSNAIIKWSSRMTKASRGDVLWNISSPTQCEATAWDESVALNVHVRNPDIVFPNGSSGYQPAEVESRF